jgi:phage tail-like protein
MATELAPFHVFRFRVDFYKSSIKAGATTNAVSVCRGAFSDCTGLEATMEPKVIKEGGRNYGHNQRVGQVSFSTVILKRGMTDNHDLWNWFNKLNDGAYASRLSVKITVLDMAGEPLMAWRLDNAMPVKFKAADLSARNNEIGIEELHLAHEGLHLDASWEKSR